MSLIQDDPIGLVRDYVQVNSHDVKEGASTAFPRNYGGKYDDAWDIEKFRDTFQIKVVRITDSVFEFDMIGVDAAIANAFRRILLAEVPTMAIEDVYIYQNTSIIPDEILAHRLGLVPILADARTFEWMYEDDGNANDCNTLVFVLDVKCSHNPDAGEDAVDAKDKYINSNVYSSHLEWIPQGSQAEWEENAIKTVHENILIAKLRPGQHIHCQMHCEKGIGREHAKWSPVCTASYRLLPVIELTEPIVGADADLLQRSFPAGVIAIDGKGSSRRARVANARIDTMAREALRHDSLKDRVKIYRRRDHFIFQVESVGNYDPVQLVKEAVKVLMRKCDAVKVEIDEIRKDDN